MRRIFLFALAVLCMSALWAAELPVTDVVLFTSGVGYIQRTGTVTGNATVNMSFKPEQINDLLKSMVLLDLDGGKVGAVTYGAKDPISKTLQSFAINITDNPTLGQLLNRLRGVPVEVVITTPITGKILGVETKSRAIGEQVIETEVLNLLTDSGLRAVRLDDVVSMRLLDAKLNTELNEALMVLATGLDNQRKPVSLDFTGAGTRRVMVGYLTEAPLWKTSYRLVMSEKPKALLQGWAVVENTSDEDWSNVRLSLVSGRPISFIQDLYTPLYLRRPVVQPQLFASLMPVQYGADLLADSTLAYDDQVEAQAEMAPLPAAKIPAGPAGPQGPNGMAAGRALSMAAKADASVSSAANASDLGQAFEYAIKEPVTLPRQKSALLPIVTGDMDIKPVSIFNADVHGKFPLYGMRVKNSTGTHLMGGPITIYNGDTYAGDATFEDLQPGEERLISYAIDLGITAERKEESQDSAIMNIKLVKGNLSITRKYSRTVDYTFAVKDGKERQLIVEHPYIADWDLVEPKKADERTDSLYRFNIPVKAGKSAKLQVVEESTVTEMQRIIDRDSDTLVSFMQTGKMSEKVKAALERVVVLQGELLDVRRQQEAIQQQVKTLREDQSRIRANMVGLNNSSDLYKRYVTKMNEQEDSMERLLEDSDKLRELETAKRTALEEYVAGLDLN